MPEEYLNPTNLVDALEMHRKNPNTFDYPEDDVETLKSGDFVKIGNGKERFWVEVDKINGDEIYGVVDNNLITTNEYNHGSKICFHRKNVYEVMTF